MHTKRLFVALALFAPACNGETRSTVLAFRGEHDLLGGFEQDTGFVPEGAPTAIRVVASASAELVAEAQAVASGNDLTPVEGSGSLSLTGGFTLEVSARVDAAGVEYEGVVETFEYALDPSMTTFDPFALEAPVSLASPLPPGELARVPLPSVPGASLVVDIAGGELETAYAGVCATAADGLAQYTASAVIDGSLELEGSIEIEVPILGTETFGPFAVEVSLPATATDLDLGTFSTADGSPAEGSPCAASGDDTDGGSSTGVDPTGVDPTGDDPTGVDPTTGDGVTTDGSGDDSTGGPGEDSSTGEAPMPACTSSPDCDPGEDCVEGSCVPVPASCSDAIDCTTCPSSGSCAACVQADGSACNQALVDCNNNAECTSIIQCVNFCDDELCHEACRQGRSQESLDLFDAALDCIIDACG